MPCYRPLRACLVEGPQGRKVVFDRKARGKGLSLPCGSCEGCLSERSRQWAVRILHESKMHLDNSFITLTYDNEHLPANGSLCVGTCQSFLKRLRARLEPIRIRFFLCGEYGEKLGRPHYHAIIFGYAFPDKKLLSRGARFPIYRSELLDKAWGLGFCSIGAVSFESASYVANYALKKVRGEAAKGHYKGRVPEFLLMSRGGRKAGGIGRSWIDKYRSDVYPSDEVIINGVPSRPPRYYDQVVDKVDPAQLMVVRDRRLEKAEFFEAAVDADGVISLRGCDGPDQSAARLLVREKVARAKMALRRRNLEVS